MSETEKQAQMTFTEHLAELRVRIIRSVIALIVGLHEKGAAPRDGPFSAGGWALECFQVRWNHLTTRKTRQNKNLECRF